MAKQMLKRKDGSTSQRGLWDNIRAAKGSGKAPSKEMLKQEKSGNVNKITMAKKVLPKHQITGIVKSSKTTPITMQQMQKEWNENERKATNPAKRDTIRMELYKKGGSTKSKKK
jgi:hypothetical protein